MNPATEKEILDIIRRAKGFGYPLTEEEAETKLIDLMKLERLNGKVEGLREGEQIALKTFKRLETQLNTYRDGVGK